jgi:SAM-dependent methyltransferase
MPRLGAALRYTANRAHMVALQRGVRASALESTRLVASEAAMLSRAVRRALWDSGSPCGEHPRLDSPAIYAALASLDVAIDAYQIDAPSFWRHVAESAYPIAYAGGSLDDGGYREQKQLEYFVSIDLLRVGTDDIVIDIASEYSIFPDLLVHQTGATVYRQDLIYRSGINGSRIGGSAAQLPLADGFCTHLVLHNAFEHFEGTSDSDFVKEAWRVLRPGGRLVILPLFVSEQHSIVSDPLVDRRGVVWDEGATVVDLPWQHIRFGRIYDAAALQRRVLTAGKDFATRVAHVTNAQAIHPRAGLFYALVMDKPDWPARGWGLG